MHPLLLVAFLLVGASAYTGEYGKASRHIVRGNFRAPRAPAGETWALLVAGSSGWYNYRHQADVAHSYQILKTHGVKEDHIIMMMYDDIAHNKQNPYKGQLYNRPHGDDVYKGVKIDYTGDDVNPENFLNVLKGNKTGIAGGNKRVIESNENDRVFVYFTDHGAVGLISFPIDVLSVKDLNDALNWMHKQKRYRQLVFYLEACESGSMFEQVLKDNINIYAITAANAHESSWGTYCDNDMELPCLGDLFSVNWMDDSDKEDIDVETLEVQYQLVKQDTDKSHVMHYGNLTIAKEPVGWFQGAKRNGKRVNYLDDTKYKKSSWPARDVELFSLMHARKRENDLLQGKKISQRITQIHLMRKWVKERVHLVVDRILEDPLEKKRMFLERSSVTDLTCHHFATEAFHTFCVNLNQFPYGMKYVYVINNLCSEFEDTDTVVEAVIDACAENGHSPFGDTKFY